MGFFSSLKRKILSTDKNEAVIPLGAELIQQRISISLAFCPGWRDVNPLRVFTYRELCNATNGFVEYFYNDRYSTYYAGIIDECDGGRPVTIKKLMWKKKSEMFIQETAVLSFIRHGNVAQLLGYCAEPPEYLLVFEGLCPLPVARSNPSAGEILWHDRLRIAIQVAEAISYIHSHGFKPIIHRDVKLSNVWLDENFNAKLSGFGFSIAMPLDDTEIKEPIAGTCGYIDPIYMASGTLTERTDVYSFGMLLGWVITGRDEVAVWYKELPKTESTISLEYFVGLRIRSSVSMTNENYHQKLALRDVFLHCTRQVTDKRSSIIEVTKLLYAIRGSYPPSLLFSSYAIRGSNTNRYYIPAVTSFFFICKYIYYPPPSAVICNLK